MYKIYILRNLFASHWTLHIYTLYFTILPSTNTFIVMNFESIFSLSRFCFIISLACVALLIQFYNIISSARWNRNCNLSCSMARCSLLPLHPLMMMINEWWRWHMCDAPLHRRQESFRSIDFILFLIGNWVTSLSFNTRTLFVRFHAAANCDLIVNCTAKWSAGNR